MLTRLLIISLTLLSTPLLESHEHTVGHHVQFFVRKDHALAPVLPVYFPVEQEKGGVTDEGVLTCDVVERKTVLEDKMVSSTVLRCGGGRVFMVRGVMFQESGNK